VWLIVNAIGMEGNWEGRRNMTFVGKAIDGWMEINGY
jgi:hypothetical protein